MKIEIGNKTKTIPLEKLKCGALFAACIYRYNDGDEKEDVFVYLYTPDTEPYRSNAVILYPEQYRGKRQYFSPDHDTIPLYGVLDIDNIPEVEDFYE